MTLFVISSEVITLLIALYGAVLATLIYFLDRRIRIRVTLGNAYTTPDLTKAISIQASNVGTKGTSLGTPYLALPKADQRILFMEPLHRNASDPYEISPGKPDLTIIENIEMLAAMIKKEGYSGQIPFRVVVPGVGGKEYKSKRCGST